MIPRLQEKYEKEILPALAEKLEAQGYAWLERGGIGKLDVEIRA